MRFLLAVALVASMALNVWLLLRDEGTAPEPPERADAVASGPTGTSTASRGGRRDAEASTRAFDELQSKLAETEKKLASAEERAADFDAMDPMAVLVYGKRPLGWKARKLLEISDERQRMTAMGKVIDVLRQKPGAAREFFDALKTETDPKVIPMLGTMVSGSLAKPTIEDRRAFAELLRSAPLPETRAAAVKALFMSEQFQRGELDEKVKANAQEMNGYLLEALKTDTAPEVAGAIANRLSVVSATTEFTEALRSAADRLPPSPSRRQVWETIAWSTYTRDGGASLFEQFKGATAQDVRDDIASGMARASDLVSGQGGPGDPAKRMEEARARFRTVFAGTSDVTVRKNLMRAALYGFGCVQRGALKDEQKADAVRFFRETAGLEGDAKQRENIERFANMLEEKGASAWGEYDKVMAAKTDGATYPLDAVTR